MLDQLYQKVILEHNKAPNNFGSLSTATHTARGTDALCGDDIEMWLLVNDGVIERAHFSGEACAVTKASASMLTEWLQGRDVAEVGPSFEAFKALLDDPDHPAVTQLGSLNHLQAVGQFPARRGNACLPWQTTLEALATPSGSARCAVR